MPAHEDLPAAFSLSRTGYYLDFVIAPLCAVALLTWAFVRSGAPAWRIVAGVAFGWLVWTLVEYAVHRFSFHGDSSPFTPMHEVHHRHPVDYVGIAPYGTLAGFVAWWGLIHAVGGAAAAASIDAGTLLGYVAYIVIHDRIHHGDRRGFGRYMRFMSERHAAHHRGGNAWFGVSSPLWDVVLRTTGR